MAVAVAVAVVVVVVVCRGLLFLDIFEKSFLQVFFLIEQVFKCGRTSVVCNPQALALIGSGYRANAKY